MAETFSYIPSYGSKSEKTPVVLSAKFGDGYEQRSADGINSTPQKWSLEFTSVANSEANSIESFLVSRGGHEWFWWTPLGESTALKFVCRKWNRTFSSPDRSSLSMDFDRVYDFGT